MSNLFDSDYSMTIDGRPSKSAEHLEVINPATEEVIAHVPDCTREQLDAAVTAARAAFLHWRTLPPASRKEALLAIAAKFEENADQLMALLTREQGKPHPEAKSEILRSALWFREIARKDLPVSVHTDENGRRYESHHVPLGVVAAITPWNFPLLLAAWKIAPALLVGNTVIWKPSPYTPLCALKIGELLQNVLPPGVLNVVSGGDRLGPWLTDHPGINKIAFTGSTATGRRVMQSAATNLKRVTLELGGNDPAIVFPDVDVPTTAEKVFWVAFRNSGQFCIAAKRVYVHEDIYDAFSQALVSYARTVRVGNGAEEGIKLGPIQNRMQFAKVQDLIASAKKDGLRFLLGGEPNNGPGYFVPITIIDNPPEDARVVVEEAFGPVLPLLKFRDTDDVIRRANHSDYGLGASVWSRDAEKAKSIAQQLESGNVWINSVQWLSPHAAYGGHKQSGIGVEHALEGLLEYTNIQTIVS
jgi:acyl-CoA reductase-like NAD-dependent aldehyde dehydrogenase